MTRLFPILLTASALLQAADPLVDVFARMDKTAQKFKGMTANIEQTSYSKMVDISSTTRGTIALTRSKKGEVRFLVDFTSGVDAPTSNSYDGTEIRTYNPKTNLEQLINVATKKQMIEQAMSLGFGASSAEMRAAYDITWVGPEKIGGQDVSHIRLAPRAKDMQERVKEVDLWISDAKGVPLGQKLTPPAPPGDYNQFMYSNITINPPLSAGDLQLKVGKGVQIRRVGN
jgi:outer membrane lipoprotein-sorting protein